MIDIENARKQFEKYVEQFNPQDKKIKLKIEHIKRVSKISRKITESLQLDEEHIRLAEVIGLFHDIGRFKQGERYNTFKDKDSVNHAEFSLKILYEDNLIEKFNIDSKYDNIIKKAVLNHNKNKIEDGLTDEELLFSKIIRDADQIATFYAYTYDLYFDYSLKYLKEQKYLDKFFYRVGKEFDSGIVKEQTDVLQKYIDRYLTQKCN